MSSRVAASLLCLVLAGAAACSGGKKPVTVYGRQTVATSKASPAIPGLPRVMVQMGTSFVDGTLVQYCKDKTCERGPGRPTRTLEGTEPLLFIVEQKPVSARAELRAAGAAEAVDASRLQSGTTMLYTPDAKPGYYLVTLTASWKGRSGSWAFRLNVPRA
jgi:hypothetical protein